MKTRSGLALALIATGFMLYTACTAEKTETRSHDASIKPETPVVETVKQAPKMVEGVFATEDHLEPVYFELNKSKLTEKEMEKVKTNVEWLKTQPPYLIRLVGFADTRGSMKKNQRLAERRAMMVNDSYVTLGIPKERISIITRGAEDPACQPVTEECLAKSRRTETLMENKSLVSR